MDRLSEKAQRVANAASEHVRAEWLDWSAELTSYLLTLELAIRELRAVVERVANDVTKAVASAVMDYAAAEDLRRAAEQASLIARIDAEQAAIVAEVRQQMIDTGAVVARLQATIDTQHAALLAELARIAGRGQ